MKTLNLLKLLVFVSSLSAASKVDAQFLSPGGPGTSLGTSMGVPGTSQGLSVQGTPATGLAIGPIGHITSGEFGRFNVSDNWAALGQSPAGFGGVLPYGLRLQKNT